MTQEHTNELRYSLNKYKEIIMLDKMLTDADIPHQLYTWLDGWQIEYTYKTRRMCSVVENENSMGMEMMGLLKDDEIEMLFGSLEACRRYSIKGNMTAEEVFDRINAHWQTHKGRLSA